MSRWITLNVQTDDPQRIIDALHELHAYQPDYPDPPDLVLYTFMSRSLGDEKQQAERRGARIAFENGAEAVVGIRAGDTADWACYTGYENGNGSLVETEFGHVALNEDENPDMMRRVQTVFGFSPDLGGNYRRPECGDYAMYGADKTNKEEA